MSLGHLQDMSLRRLQDVLQDVFETSSKRLGRHKIFTLNTCWRRLQDMSWRRLEDVFKTNKCFLGSSMKRITKLKSTNNQDNFPIRNWTFVIETCAKNGMLLILWLYGFYCKRYIFVIQTLLYVKLWVWQQMLKMYHNIKVHYV